MRGCTFAPVVYWKIAIHKKGEPAMAEQTAMTSVGILAHVDAGKTTLSEQILYQTGALRQAGRVDRQNAFLDDTDIERRRGITVFAEQASFSIGERRFTLLDTPGHADFSGEAERCLSVLDCAVLVLSSVEGIQAHTRTLWRLLRERRIPTMLFFNKIDRPGARPQEVRQAFAKQFGVPCVDFSDGLQPDGAMLDVQVQAVAELDDILLETYLEKGYQPALWLERVRALFARGAVVPTFAGAALSGEGVAGLLNGLALLSAPPQGTADAPFQAKAYKVRHDSGGRVVFLRVQNGELHPKDLLQVPGENPDAEKCNELRVYQGNRFVLAPKAGPGAFCAVTGVQGLSPGDTAGVGAAHGEAYRLQPMLSARVLFAESVSAGQVLTCFRELEDEEPLLHVRWNEPLRELEVQVMGKVQLEVLAQLAQERYGLTVRFGACRILYRETIAAPVVGCGHFEPLRHYAEVHLQLCPGKPGSGITFESCCPQDVLAGNWQNLIGTHVLEKEHRGVLTGAPLTDVRVVLLSGRAHLKHTEGGDFREATYRAVRQGLMQAQSVLLEPWYAFAAEVDFAQSGRVLSDVQRMHGTCEPLQESGGRALLRGAAPVSEMMEYPAQLTAFTKGQGSMTLAFGGYQPCHNTQQVVRQAAYEPERDVENTPDSVFCSHGAGYPVKWQDAPGKMHLPVETAAASV